MKDEIATCEAALAERTRKRGFAAKFADLFDQYTTFDDLTPAILHQFVDHIVVHERTIKGSPNSPQQIDIYFNFIGNFIPPDFIDAPPTPEQLEEMQKQAARREKYRQAYQRRKANGTPTESILPCSRFCSRSGRLQANDRRNDDEAAVLCV